MIKCPKCGSADHYHFHPRPHYECLKCDRKPLQANTFGPGDALAFARPEISGEQPPLSPVGQFLVVRITYDARAYPPQYRAYGPVDQAEARALVAASADLFAKQGMQTAQRNEERVTSWTRGSPITMTVMTIPLSPATPTTLKDLTSG